MAPLKRLPSPVRPSSPRRGRPATPRWRDVPPGRAYELMVHAPLKSSLVQFAGFPPEALARIGTDIREASETKDRPFKVVTPPEGATALVHSVTYEVTVGGKRVQGGTVNAVPGKPLLIEKKDP